ncbi:DinB family protein [Acidobacteria bacterium AB60]|nr:DinB family protein [Acidobacteria bacterium AB60]
MQKEVLLDILKQSEMTTQFAFHRIGEANTSWRLNEKAASIGFIYRHVGETMNLFALMLGTPTEVVNTTIGATDEGQAFDLATSRKLVARGYGVLRAMVEDSADEDWLKPVETPFFGTVSRIRLFSHALFHTSGHAGQIALTLARGTGPESSGNGQPEAAAVAAGL